MGDKEKMSLSDWLLIGVVGLTLKKGFERSIEDQKDYEHKYQEHERECRRSERQEARKHKKSERENEMKRIEREKELQQYESEFNRRLAIKKKRWDTPCRFADGISAEDFAIIAHKAEKKIRRIKDLKIRNATIYCTAESQTGFSDWEFHVDFNDWGHLTGTYWTYTENDDSNIPKHFGDMVSGEIHQMLKDKNIHLPEFSDYVDENKALETSSGLSFSSKTGLFKKMFSQKKQIISRFDSRNLLGEHIYPVISMLKSNGFKNVKSIPIKDVGHNSNHYVFEVEQVVVNGILSFNVGDTFPENTEVTITYHAKQEITIQRSMNYFRKGNYIDVGDQLQDMGFSNIYERKIQDLVTGWVTKDGSVEQVLVEIDGQEVPINKNQPYEFDTKIVITYHTFS